MEYNKVRGTVPTSEPRSINALKAKYRRKWDTHQLIADDNAQLLYAGKQPSNEQLINEQGAAEAVKFAGDTLRRELGPRARLVPTASVVARRRNDQ